MIDPNEIFLEAPSIRYHSHGHLWILLAAGVMGFAFAKLGYRLAPLLLAMVLGDKAGNAFFQSMILSDGSPTIFFSNPLVATIMTIASLLLLTPQLMKLATGRQAKLPADE